MAVSLPVEALVARDQSETDKFLALMSSPFSGQLASDSVLYALGTSVGMAALIFLAFCILRPFNAVVYAPKLRHADDKHRPPPVGKGMFDWYKPVFQTQEDLLAETIGMDATIFLRVTRMCRNMFPILAIIGCGILIPINVINNNSFNKSGGFKSSGAMLTMTPQGLFGSVFWAFVGVAWIFDIVICGFLWWNYRRVHRLRRNYLNSPEYLNSLHSRTLMITEIPRNLRSDQGIIEITDSLRTTPEVPRASIGRNVKEIPELIEEHEQAVIDLEKVLAKYLRDPNKIPASRPMCKPSKKDPEFSNKSEKVDAITYLTARIERLEHRIKEARESVDKRDAMPFGFASYESVESAHTVAFSARSKHPQGTTVQLAPRPKDLIWKNLSMDAKTKRWRRFINNLWVILLTAFYCVPNALIAVFLAKLSNLGAMWPAFQTVLEKNPQFWAIVQGIASPAITTLFYYFLPAIFRKLSMNMGDKTKTSRDRHVIHQLYSFFIVNNLFAFSLFATGFTVVATVVNSMNDQNQTFTEALGGAHPFVLVMTGLCQVSPYWVTWLLQRNLGAAIDLSQIVNLAWGSFSRKFLNPTPRDLIKRTAPPPFDYASYYNYYLFYTTVALVFATIQPICLVVVTLYFFIDVPMKKYLLMYVFSTKHESGGQYWRLIFNRFLVGTFISNCLVALMVGARAGDTLVWPMLGCMIPLPLLLIGFKFYCKSAFDNQMKYYTTGNTNKGAEAATPIDKESRRRDRVAVRFGHPALYQKLTVPMVNEKSKHLLAELYKGRLDGDVGGAGYSDIYMKRMSKEPGKVAAASTGPFEFVSESNMDFENFKNRAEFRDEHGDGSLYGHESRPGTPSTVMGHDRGRSASRDSERMFGPPSEENGVTYPAGYHHTPSALREYSPAPTGGLGLSRLDSNDAHSTRDNSALLGGAAPMGHDFTPYSVADERGSTEYFGARR